MFQRYRLFCLYKPSLTISRLLNEEITISLMTMKSTDEHIHQPPNRDSSSVIFRVGFRHDSRLEFK
jgi:hypothetical protein